MFTLTAASIIVCLAAAGVAVAQPGGGREHGGGRHGGAGEPSSSSSPAPADTPVQKPMSQIGIVGVVRAIDPQTGHITIQYEAVDDLDLPRGTQAFEAAKSALLNGVTVGEKVRFTLESHEIASLQRFVPPPEQ
jgi:Cu/Ag efflux protein CusF